MFHPLIDSADYPVTVDSNSAVLGFGFNQTEKNLRLNVTGTTGTAGSCDVIVPDSLLWGEFSLSMDGYPLVEGADYTQTHNGTHYLFHITYIHRTHTIEIVASNETTTEPEPTEPEPTEEAPLITIEVAIIATVAIAYLVGVVGFWALKKRK